MALEFEEILPYVEGEGDTGKTAREKINRNFTKIEPLANVGAEMQQLRQDVADDLEQLRGDVEEMVDKTTSLFGYYNCSTAGATAAKTVQATDYELTTGGNTRIKMEYANTAASPVSLQIGNAAAQTLYYNGEAVSDENTWEDGETIVVYYDGEKYLATSTLGGGGNVREVHSDVVVVDGLGTTLTEILVGEEVKPDEEQTTAECTVFSRTNGFAIGSDGKAYQAASGTAVSEYIPISQNTSYTCNSSVWNKNANIGLAFYSAENEESYIQGSFRCDTVNTYGKASGVVPEGAMYIRVTWPAGTSGFYSFLNTLKYYKSTTQAYSKIERLSGAVDDNAQNIQSNAADIKDIQDELNPIVWKDCVLRYGAKPEKSGNAFILYGADNYYSNKFDVEEGDVYKLTGYNGAYTYPYVITDENNLAIEGGAGTGGGTSDLDGYEITIPSGARYLFVGFSNSRPYKVAKKVQSTYLSGIEDTISNDKDEEVGYDNAIISNIRVRDSLYKAEGRSVYIPIVGGRTYIINANTSNGAYFAFLKNLDNIAADNTPHFAAGYTISKSIGAGLSAEVTAPLDANYLFIYCSEGTAGSVYSPSSIIALNVSKSIVSRLTDIETRSVNQCTYKDATNLMMYGSSITASAQSPVSWSWIERLNDIVDVLIENRGKSGSSNLVNITALAANTKEMINQNTDYDSELGKPQELNPHFIMLNNSANDTPVGSALEDEYEISLSIIESYGAKMLIGCEPWGYSGHNNGDADRGQKAFLAKNPTVKGVPMQFYAFKHFLEAPYHGFVDYLIADVHPGYRCQTPMVQHSELISLLPIRKSVKMYKIRPNYTVNSVNDLCYDTSEQRLLYFYAINCGVQRGESRSSGVSTAHADNVDYNYNNTIYDVPNGVNSNFGTSETAALKRGHTISFNTWALCEFILDRVKVTKGIFTIKSNVEPTAVYIAYTPRVYDATSTIRTKWLEAYSEYDDGVVTCVIDRNKSYDFQRFDRVRILINYASGDMELSQPCFFDYDGEEKPEDNRLSAYHFRQYGIELMDKTSVEDGWTLTGTAAVKAFPAEIANYPTGWTDNNTKQHISLAADGDTMQKAVSLGNHKANKVAIRVECQIFPKIATTRTFESMTSEQLAEYIDATKPTIKEYDYCWQTLVLTVNGGSQQKRLVSVGWQELYFEVDIENSDTNLAITIGRQSGWSNADLPMLIYNVSAQIIE